jgi:hypothetical protein
MTMLYSIHGRLLFFLLMGFLTIHAQTGKVIPPEGTFIFSPIAKHVHGSSLAVLPNGDMLAVWFQGSGERSADDVQIMGSRLVRGSFKWSEPFAMADTKDIPDCNPVLFMNDQGRLFLVWIVVQANKWESSILKFKTSVDYDKPGPPIWNWQDNIFLKPDDRFASETEARFKELPRTGAGWSAYAPRYDEMLVQASHDVQKRSMGWMTRIKPLLLENGRILLPLYSDGFNFSMIAISDDHGENWRPSLPLISRGGVQPALVKKKNGNIMAFMRDNGDEPGRVQVSESRDSGMSWTAAIKTDIPNPGSSVEVIVMKDGRWAFVGNDTEEGRHRLSLFISVDEGRTWPLKKQLEQVEPGKGGFSYPCLIQASDGSLRLTYSFQLGDQGETIKYLVIDPSSIRQ